MKKIMMMLALMLTLTTFAFAGEAINKQALNAFQNEFAGATDIAWKVSGNYYEVAFTIDHKRLAAFYDDRGDFVAVTRFISSGELPNGLRKSLKRGYGNAYWVSDLFDVTTGDETSYYVTIENADTRVVLRSINGSHWALYERMDKK